MSGYVIDDSDPACVRVLLYGHEVARFADLQTAAVDWAMLHEELLRLRERSNDLDEIEAIVAKLPRTADGVPIVPGMEMYLQAGLAFAPENCYSTYEAAVAARDKALQGTDHGTVQAEESDQVAQPLAGGSGPTNRVG